MTELTTEIGAFDKDKRVVSVTFTSGEIVHTRDVNAVLDADGAYDVAGTEARVEEVARGVAYKFELGVIVAQPPEPEAPADEPSEE